MAQNHHDRLPDAAKVSAALSEKTLQKMREEYDRLHAEDAPQRVPARSAFPRLLRYAAPMAACLLLALGIGLFANRPTALGPVLTIDMAKLPAISVGGRSGAEDTGIAQYAQRLGLDFEALFPGWTLDDARVESVLSVAAQGAEQATLSYHKNDDRLTLVVCDIEPVLLKRLRKDSKPASVLGRDVYLAKDTASATSYACLEADGHFFQLSSATLDAAQLASLCDAFPKGGGAQ